MFSGRAHAAQQLSAFPCRMPGCGFTALVVGILSIPRLAHLTSGDKVLGGAGELNREIIDRCYGRMANFVSLVAASIRAEYPAHELIQSFKVFRLNVSLRGGLPRDYQDALHRMAKVFQVNPQELIEQYEIAHYHAACLHKSASSGTHSYDAWAETMLKLHDRRARKVHASDALAHVMHRYLAFCGCTTSGVEHAFSTVKRVLTDHRTGMSARAELGELKSHRDFDWKNRDELVKQAREVWRTVYGEARTVVRRKFSVELKKRKVCSNVAMCVWVGCGRW